MVCSMCRGTTSVENNVQYLLRTDKNNQFEIVGVSLDKNKESWQKAIDRFQITWIQISDLKFWKSPVAKLYEIEELPFNVIIDGQGTIVAKNLHGKELEDFIKKSLT